MADIIVDVSLPNPITANVTSPTQALGSNVYIPGPQGPAGPKGNPTTINSLGAENIIITGADGNIVYTTGLNTIFISGNSGYFQSAVNSLTTNLNSTGSSLINSINSLSGLFTGHTGSLDNNYATDAQLQSTGSNLYTLLTNFSGNLDATYASDLQLYNTGSTLDNKINSLSGYSASAINLASTGSNLYTLITNFSGNLDADFASQAELNSLSGYVNSQDTSISNNLILTGSTLDSKINSLSGYSASAINLTSTGITLINNLFNTGSNLNTKIDNLSGYVNTQDASISNNLNTTGSTLDLKINALSGVTVLTYGNQTINGLKDFITRPTVNTTPVLLSGDIPYVQNNSYFYVDATRTDSYIENGNILYPYKTLSGAYNAAKNIAYFHNPTYITLLSPIAENLTIDKGYINLVGNNTNKNDPIRITGSLVFAATGIGSTITDNNFSIAGLGVTATSNNKCILFSGNNPQRLFIQDCWLIAKDNGTCLYSNNTNTTSRLQGDILKLSPEGVNTTAIDIVSGTSSISFAETSSSANVLAYVRNNSTLNISNSQIETNGVKAFQVENTARLTLLNSVLTNTANPSTGIFLKDAFSTAVVVGSAISVPANANSYAINGVANSYLFYKNLYFSIDAIGGSTESKIGNNVNKNLINSYDPVVYSIGNQTISGIKTFTEDLIVQKSGFFWSGIKIGLNSIIITEESIQISGDPVVVRSTFTGYTGDVVNTYATITNLASTGSTLQTNINNLSNTYATISNLASTGSTLNTRINDLSEYVNTQDNSISTNLYNTGNTLNNKINSLSGSSVLLYGNQTIGGVKTFTDNIYINNLFVTGTETIVNTNNFNVQSPYLVLNLTGGAVDGGIFFVTGAGLTGINDSGPIIGFDHSTKFKFGISTRNSDHSTLPDIASVQEIEAYSGVANNTFSTMTNLAATGNTLNNRINSLSGYVDSQNTTISNNLRITGSTLDSKINSLSGWSASAINLASTGSTLDSKINSLSGWSASATNLATTGSTLNTRINNLSGYINSSSSNIVFTTGNQTISGTKTFIQDTVFGDSAQGDFLVISGNNFTVYGSGNFTSGLFVNGNPVLTGSSTLYATTVNLASTGSTLDNKINNLSGVSVLIFGDQTISGNKTFINRLSASTGFFGDNIFAFGNWIGISAGSGNYASGNYAFIGGGQCNRATATYATVGGGASNFASGIYSTIGGGQRNGATAANSNVGGGCGNCAVGSYSNVGGGCLNCASGISSTIGGGVRNCAIGNSSNIGGGCLNCATAPNSTVGGGVRNCAIGNCSTIGGGCYNTASGAFSNIDGGYRNITFGDCATVGGGACNRACLSSATIGGGCCNTASGAFSFLGGGFCNSIVGIAAIIVGGCCNSAIGDCATVGGGACNRACANFATVGGGGSNTACSIHTTVGGGCYNRACANFATVGGGCCNTASVNNATVGGGGCNTACNSFATVAGGCYNRANGTAATVGGGCGNCAVCASATVGGGCGNRACCDFATVGGGCCNFICSTFTTIGGGVANCACGSAATVGGGATNRACLNFATVAGGCYNRANGTAATVGGGYRNAACNSFATVGGGSCNSVLAEYSYILGGRCSTIISAHSGAAVLGDGQLRPHNSFSAHSLTLDFNSGVYFSDKKIFGAVPELNTVTSNFPISGIFNGEMILANSPTIITGVIASGNVIGFNTSIIQISSGQIQITGSGIGITIGSFNNQYRTAGQFATISILHTGNDGYIMYGNTST